jgi:type IV pilus assembly protein PilC
LLAVGEKSHVFIPTALAVIVVVALLVYRWQRSEAGAAQVDRIRLRVPLFGGIYEKYQVSAFARMLSTLLSGGIPLVQALDTAGNSLTSAILASTAVRAAESVREGRPLARSLAEGNFPELAVEMVEVGESTGALPQMLTSAAEFYEEDVQTALAAALSLIEPAILIIMGLVVAFVLISLYLPIFSIGAAAGAASQH